VPACFCRDFAESYHKLKAEGYTIFVLAPAGGEGLAGRELPLKSAFVFGHEQFGISFDSDEYDAVRTLSILQCGQVESLNVSVAASIVMYEYVRQHGCAPGIGGK
jgi:tRNA G18 (ribose-2'-O)-methylase SpoU